MGGKSHFTQQGFSLPQTNQHRKHKRRCRKKHCMPLFDLVRKHSPQKISAESQHRHAAIVIHAQKDTKQRITEKVTGNQRNRQTGQSQNRQPELFVTKPIHCRNSHSQKCKHGSAEQPVFCRFWNAHQKSGPDQIIQKICSLTQLLTGTGQYIQSVKSCAIHQGPFFQAFFFIPSAAKAGGTIYHKYSAHIQNDPDHQLQQLPLCAGDLKDLNSQEKQHPGIQDHVLFLFSHLFLTSKNAGKYRYLPA